MGKNRNGCQLSAPELVSVFFTTDPDREIYDESSVGVENDDFPGEVTVAMQKNSTETNNRGFLRFLDESNVGYEVTSSGVHVELRDGSFTVNREGNDYSVDIFYNDEFIDTLLVSFNWIRKNLLRISPSDVSFEIQNGPIEFYGCDFDDREEGY
jgi:hypothetical protein